MAGEQRFLVAIDTSGSTWNCFDYFEAAVKICEMFDVTEFISWSNTAEIMDSSRLREEISDGGTEPQHIVHKIREVYAEKLEDLKNYGLVILSDGEICDNDITHTKMLLGDGPKLTFREIKLFYFGDVDGMNTGLNEVFKDIPTEIFINQLDESILNTNMIYTEEEIEHVLEKPKNELISMVNYFVITKNHKCLLQIKKLLQDSYTSRCDLSEFIERNDIEGCVKMFRQIETNENKKACQNFINIIDNCINEKNSLSLSRLATYSRIYEKLMDFPEDENVDDGMAENGENEEEMEHECEITYMPCNAIGIGVKKIESLFKKYGKDVIVPIENNPFKLLTDDPLMQEIRSVIVNAFEYNKISAYVMDKLNKENAPFTGNDLIGWFYFADKTLQDDSHVKTVLHNNMYAVGNIFNGVPKMRGNWEVWHLVVLYILGTEHKKHSEQNKFIFEQIQYLSKVYDNYLPLTSYYEPSIKDKLHNCFWYICNICPEFKFAGSSNVLRTYGTGLVQFCKTSFNFDDSQNLMRFEMWKLWENVVRNMKYVDALRMLKSRFQNYLYIDEKCYLLNGKSKDGNSSHINPIIPDNIILQMIQELKKNSSPNVFFGSILKHPEPFEIAEDLPTTSNMKNVRICTTTYRPTILDYETGKSWREIVPEFDCKPEHSFFNLYLKFVREYKKYPDNSGELLKFILNKYKENIWYSDMVNMIEMVFNSFKPFVNVDIKKFSVLLSADERLKLENNCTCSAHNRKENCNIM